MSDTQDTPAGGLQGALDRTRDLFGIARAQDAPPRDARVTYDARAHATGRLVAHLARVAQRVGLPAKLATYVVDRVIQSCIGIGNSGAGDYKVAEGEPMLGGALNAMRSWRAADKDEERLLDTIAGGYFGPDAVSPYVRQMEIAIQTAGEFHAGFLQGLGYPQSPLTDDMRRTAIEVTCAYFDRVGADWATIVRDEHAKHQDTPEGDLATMRAQVAAMLDWLDAQHRKALTTRAAPSIETQP